jgi:hypothetical protein
MNESLSRKRELASLAVRFTYALDELKLTVYRDNYSGKHFDPLSKWVSDMPDKWNDEEVA